MLNNQQGKDQGLMDSRQFILLQHLPSSMKKIQSKKKYGLLSLFRFADRTDYLLMGMGFILSLCSGACFPVFALFWGDMIDEFKSTDDLVEQTFQILLKFIYIGLGVMFFGWMMISCWVISGQRQSVKCKKAYLESLLQQQIGWFESSNQFQITSSYPIDAIEFQAAISHNIPFILDMIGMGISGLAISFSKGWFMSIVLFVSIPAIVFTKFLYSKLNITKEKTQEKFYSQAGARAQEALSSLKTVKMMNGQDYESEKYDKCLQKTKNGSQKYSILFGLSFGGASFFIMSAFSFGLWYGSHCIRGSESCPQSISKQIYSVGTVFTVFFSMVVISFHLSHLPYNIKKLMLGIVSAGRIFKIIDRQTKIKNPQNGIRLENFNGVIRFNNVTFSYPKDPQRKILDGLNMQITKKKIALVGQSGSGKSTIIQLLLRFYDPDQGQITIDGVNLKDIDLVWWRQQLIGYVGQEPVLFATTIKENLLISAQNSTQQQISNALKKAEVYDFVNGLEKRLDTYVGSGGCQVSGGQKQRIAIARAVIRKPKLLILDEATSALDRKTEKSIQRTLNQVSAGILSITIAHRTKTIIKSDEIFVIEKGKVKESGKFKDLKQFEDAIIQDQDEEFQKKMMNYDKQQKQEQKKLQKQQGGQIQKQKQIKNVLCKILSFGKQNLLLLIIPLSTSAIVGSAFPLSSIFLVDLITQMLIPSNPNLQDRANKDTVYVLFIATAIFLALNIQMNILERVGRRISLQMRSKTFRKLLKLPISWHQREQNKPAVLTSKLSVGAYEAKQLATTFVFGLLEILLCLITGLVIAFVYEWKLGLIQLAFVPINMLTSGYTAKYRNGKIQKEQQTSSIAVINEAVTNIKTVYSLGYQKKITKNYYQILKKPLKQNAKDAVISGFFYGLGEALIFVTISILFYIGAIFIKNNTSEVKNVFTVVYALFFATNSIGQMGNILPNIKKCIDSSKQILRILETKDEQQLQVENNSLLIKNKKIKGNISIRNIRFKYPSRSEYLFNGFSLDLVQGRKMAFVGSSGCGKSTILAFLLRFYQPQSGQIIIDGINIKDYDIHYLRSQFGVVSQQPVMFNASLKENIQYNMVATDQQIIQAARKAYMLDFINKFSKEKVIQPQYSIQEEVISGSNFVRKISIKVQKLESSTSIEDFNRSVGLKGNEISGGQKQRLAIARAILRNPQVLLLDEATSALDAENENKVTKCLDQIMNDKTSIIVAHRLETIANSDVIYVFEKGVVVESGTYQELLSHKGYFYRLQKGIDLL